MYIHIHAYMHTCIHTQDGKHDMDIAVTFAFSDGSRMEDAFTYSWRVWPMAKV
jgi:hypothetical protein